MSNANDSYSGGPGMPPPLDNSGHPAPPVRTSGAAVFAFLLGLGSLAFWVIAAVPAIILAFVAKSDIRANPGTLRGSGLATAGMIFGLMGLFVPFFWLMLFMLAISAPATGGGDASGQRIAHFHLAGSLLETPMENTGELYFQSLESLKGLVERIDRAREDDTVEALLLTVSGPVLGTGQLEEVWRAIGQFKTSGKKVFAHGAALQTGSYALLSGASRINVVPTDSVWLIGMSLSEFHLKDALDKIGVEADVLHMGDYKAAGEMFSRSGPSEAARANTDWLLDGLYDGIVGMIAESRGLTKERVNALIDGGPYTVDEALEAGLVDSVAHLDEFLEQIRDEYGDEVTIDNHYGYDDGAQPGPFSFASLSNFGDGDTVAIVYVEGMIFQGYGGSSPFGTSTFAYSGDIVNLLNQAAEDDSIRAVVLRIDSPGGSAVASEEILQAAIRLQQSKPLIVSMGSTAASGGYYIACKADTIFADAMTITASIGVISTKFVLKGMWDELGVNWTQYTRGANAGILSSNQPFTDAERERMIAMMADTYSTFKGHVIAGRGDLLTKAIDEMTGGRVYTGKQALELGLVDELGGLHEAIEHAADRANIEDYTVRVLPEAKSFFQALMEGITGTGGRPSDLYFDETRAAPVRVARLIPSQKRANLPAPLAAFAMLEPQEARAAGHALAAMTLLRREGVATLMPRFIVLR